MLAIGLEDKMPPRYACFVSYRHPQYELVKTFVEEFTSALKQHAEGWVDEEVFLDENIMRGGDVIDNNLARAICQSACFILIFTPKVFSKDHTWCVREFVAMKRIQEVRFAELNINRGQRNFEMIIPIILRGKKENLHPELQNVLYYDFNDWNLSNPKISSNPIHANKIEEISQRISMLLGLTKDIVFDCDTFTLPGSDDPSVIEVLSKVRPYIDPPFPGRLAP